MTFRVGDRVLVVYEGSEVSGLVGKIVRLGGLISVEFPFHARSYEFGNSSSLQLVGDNTGHAPNNRHIAQELPP